MLTKRMGIAMSNEGLRNKDSSTSGLESIHKQTIPAFIRKQRCNEEAISGLVTLLSVSSTIIQKDNQG